MPEERPMQYIIMGAIVSVLAAMVTALLDEGSIRSKARTLLAGLCSGVLLSIVLRNSKMMQLYKDSIIALSSAFIRPIWPVVRNLLRKYLNKKGDDIIHH